MTGSSPGLERQRLTDAYFEASSAYWKDIYEFEDVQATIYQERRAVVLWMVRELGLARGTPILEIGCGSGLTSVALAQDGYAVQAIDSANAMIQLTRQLADDSGVADRVITNVGDIHDLGFPDKTFDLVLKIGVAPWLHSLDQAVREVARVLRPGGYLITTADNCGRLNHWLDPRYFPPFGSLRRGIRGMLERATLLEHKGASARFHSIREFDACLAAAGLKKIQGRTLGFGPFSFLGRNLLSDSSAVRVHHCLQDLADRGVPVLRSAGTQYIVLARKGVAL